MEVECPNCKVKVTVKIMTKIKTKKTPQPNVHTLARALTLPPENQEEAPYEIRDSVGLLISAYKMQLGFNPADRKWDEVNYARSKPPAISLLQFFDNDYKRAKDCLVEISEFFKSKGLAWSINAVLKHAPEWRKQNVATKN